MKKINTLRFILQSGMGCLLGLISVYFFPGGILDLRWWILLFTHFSIVYTYNHFDKVLDRKEFED